jgi:hypothetical protein
MLGVALCRAAVAVEARTDHADRLIAWWIDDPAVPPLAGPPMRQWTNGVVAYRLPPEVVEPRSEGVV